MRLRPHILRGAAFAGLLVLTWAALTCVPYLPTHDGPNHFASCVLSYRLDSPEAGLQRYLAHNFPLTTQGFQVPCRMLLSVFEPFTALQVTLGLLIVGFAMGFAFVAKTLQPDTPWWAVGFAVAFSWPLYMGFFSFYAAVGLSFWVLGLVLSLDAKKPSIGGWVGVSALLLLTAYAHVFQAALCGLLVLCISLVRAPRERRWRAAVTVVLTGLPSFLLVLAVTMIFREAGSTWGLTTNDPGGDDSASGLWSLPQLLVGGGALRTWPPLLLVVAIAMVSLRHVRGTSWLQRVFMGFGAIAFAVGLGSPMDLPHWSYFAPRLFLFPLMLMVIGAPVHLSPGAKRGWEIVCVAAAVLHLGATIQANRKLYATVEADLVGLKAPLSRNGPRLPIILNEPKTDFAFVEPGHGLGHLYLAAHGGINPMVWAESRAIDPMVFVADPATLFGHGITVTFGKSFADAFEVQGRAAQKVAIDVWASWGAKHQDVILSAKQRWPAEQFVMRGYDVDFQEGRVTILKFRGCALDLKVQASQELVGEITVSTGVDSSTHASTKLITTLRLSPGAVVSVPVSQQLCGRGWIELDLKGSASSQRYLCREFRGARAGLNLTQSSTEVLCSLALAKEVLPGLEPGTP